MKVNLFNVKNGFIKWYDENIATMGWKTMLLAPVIPVIFDNYVDKNKEMLQYVFDADNNVDIDILYNKYMDILNRNGKLEITGLVFDKSDLTKLYESIKSTTVK